MACDEDSQWAAVGTYVCPDNHLEKLTHPALADSRLAAKALHFERRISCPHPGCRRTAAFSISGVAPKYLAHEVRFSKLSLLLRERTRFIYRVLPRERKFDRVIQI